jgi:hypothetical protein
MYSNNSRFSSKNKTKGNVGDEDMQRYQRARAQLEEIPRSRITGLHRAPTAPTAPHQRVVHRVSRIPAADYKKAFNDRLNSASRLRRTNGTYPHDERTAILDKRYQEAELLEQLEEDDDTRERQLKHLKEQRQYGNLISNSSSYSPDEFYENLNKVPSKSVNRLRQNVAQASINGGYAKLTKMGLLARIMNIKKKAAKRKVKPAKPAKRPDKPTLRKAAKPTKRPAKPTKPTRPVVRRRKPTGVRK